MEAPFEIPAGLTLESDVSVASWIEPRLLPFRGSSEGVLVGELVPSGFEDYARVLHPISRRVGDRDDLVTWAEVARERDKRIHPEVRLSAVMDADPFALPIELGSLPQPTLMALVAILREVSGTHDRCWFCIWEGYGIWFGGTSLRAVPSGAWRRWLEGRSRRREAVRRSMSEGEVLARLTKVELMGRGPEGTPQRRYLLFRGPIDATPRLHSEWHVSPNYWWPENRAWCVVSELDATSTYIGGSKPLVEWILQSPDLEAVPVELGHRFAG